MRGCSSNSMSLKQGFRPTLHILLSLPCSHCEKRRMEQFACVWTTEPSMKVPSRTVIPSLALTTSWIASIMRRISSKSISGMVPMRSASRRRASPRQLFVLSMASTSLLCSLLASQMDPSHSNLDEQLSSSYSLDCVCAPFYILIYSPRPQHAHPLHRATSSQFETSEVE